MYKVKEKNSKKLYTKIALFALIALISIFCGTMLFFNSLNGNDLESKKLYAATTVSTEAALIDAINSGETQITLGANITVASTINLSNVTISGSTRTLTVSSSGVINLGSSATINISSLSVSGIINITGGTVQNTLTVTDSGICNIISGTLSNVTVNSSAQFNMAEPTANAITISGTITLDNHRYINVGYPITNSSNRFKVHVNNGTSGDDIVKYDKSITDAQAVLSTFQLYNNSTFSLGKRLNEDANGDYYSLYLILNSGSVNYVAYNGETSFSSGPSIEVRLNGTLIGTLTASNRSLVIGATSGTLTISGNYISVNSDFSTNPTSLTTCSSKTYSLSGATSYNVYARDIYTLTMDANGGSPDTTKYKVYGIDQTVSYSTKPILQHYEFSHWDTQQNGGGTTYNNGDNYTSNANLTVYAQWVNGNSDYTVKHYRMDTDGQYPITSTYQETKHGIFGTTVNVQDLIRSALLVTNGIEYDHAEVDGVTVTQTTILEDDSRVICMYYRRLQHTLTLSCGTGISSVINGGVETTSARSYYYGQTATMDATLEEDYVFLNWTGYQTKNTKNTTVTMPAEDIAFTANGVEEVDRNITITVNYSDYGSASPTSFTAKNNSSILISGNTIKIGKTTVTATPAAQTAEWTYSFDSWSGVPAGNKVTGDLTVTANFAREKRQYTVTWKNWDNSVLDTDLVDYGDYANWGSRPAPTRPDDEMYHDYVWDGWDGLGLLEPITGDTSFVAIFTGTINKYTITWKNWDGTVLETDTEVPYGSTPSYDGATPTKPSDTEHNYTFSYWTPDIAAVTGDQDYIATFTDTSRTYTITWKNWDGTTLETDLGVAYNAQPSYDGATPTKASDSENSYTFSGWTPEVHAVDGDQEYVATFTPTAIQYHVTIEIGEDGYGTVSQNNVSVVYDTAISCSDNVLTVGSTQITATPKDDTDQYHYSFTSWSNIPANGKVTEDITITVHFTRSIRQYTVLWKNQDGTITLETDENVYYGSLPSYNKSSNPTKAATVEYTYTFAGWAITPNAELGTDANNLPEVHGDTTYYAAFSKTKNKYTITWKNWNGTTLTTDQVEYGEMPSYTGSTPQRPREQDVSYQFDYWTPTIVAVTGDATYTAHYSEAANQYIVTIEVDNGEYGSVDEVSIAVDYNTDISVLDNVLTIGATTVTATEEADTAQYDYSFAGWTNVPAGGKVIDDVTITAHFTRVVKAYTIVWKDEDGTVLETDYNVPYDTTPTYNGPTPTKASDAEHNYTFKNWTPAVTKVTGDAEYTATYNSTTRKYTITWLNWDNTPLCEPTLVNYNTLPVYPGETPTRAGDEYQEYEFKGWLLLSSMEMGIVNATEDATYKAQFNDVVHQYTILVNFSKIRTITNPTLQLTINNEKIDITNEGSIERTLNYGTQISIRADVQGKYNMVWAEEDIAAEKTNVLQMTAFVLREDVEFTLYISQLFTVDVVYDDTMGRVTQGETITAISGDDVVLNAEALNGYKFVSWSKNGYFDVESLTRAQTTITSISSDCEIEANFEIVNYKIRLLIDGVQTEINYNINSSAITLPEPTKDGFNFIGWTGSNGNAPQKNVIVEAGSFGDKTFIANFSKPEGNEKLIIIIAAAAAVVATIAIITIVVVAKKRKGRRRNRRPITIDLSKFK